MIKDKTKVMNSNKTKKNINFKQKEIPLGSLMLQIGQLKKQLKFIKDKRQLVNNQITFNRAQSSINLNYHKKTQQQKNQQEQIQIQQLVYQERDKKLKMDIQLNKLRKYISKLNGIRIMEQLNQVIRLVNIFNEHNSSELQKYKSRYFQSKLQNQIGKGYNDQEIKQKYHELVKINQNLELQVKQLQNNVLKKINNENEVRDVDKQNIIYSQELKKAYYQKNILQISNQQITENLHDVTQKLADSLQKIKIYENSLQKKQCQLVLMEEDLKYLRMQSEKFHMQKKEMEILYQTNNKNFRDFKNQTQGEIDRIVRENTKLQYQLTLRRNQSQQLIQLQSQKNILYKQLQSLRQDLQKKAMELSEVKGLLYESNKKNLSFEAQLYRVKTQNQKLERNIQMCKKQLTSLYEEVEELKIINQTKSMSKKTKVKEPQKKQKQHKVKALNEIQEMIRKHKVENTNN